MAKPEGYLYISDMENYELLSVLADAHRDLDEPTKGQAGEWIDRLTKGNRRGIDAVALDQTEAVELIDCLYQISGEAETGLHIESRAQVYRLEETLKEARVPVRRTAMSNGPGR